MTFDLDSFEREHVKGWGDRMTIGVLVADLRGLTSQLRLMRAECRELQRLLRATEDRLAALLPQKEECPDQEAHEPDPKIER